MKSHSHSCERFETAIQNDSSLTYFICILSTALVILGGLAGCGGKQPPLAPVTGKVAMDGQPLTAGSIVFHPDAANAFQDDNPSSLLQLDGSFTMRTFPFGDGVPPGKYKVTLAPELASRIRRPQYADPQKTPWSIEVPENGLNGHVFDVQERTK
jgi:hypothetical protein